jgi:ABC-type uncharacterized transport system involved in gliding motility auxiliary subunit
MASSGFLSPRHGATTTLTPLITTSRQAMRFDTTELAGTPDPVRLLRAYKSEDRSFVLAARLHGPVKSAFPDGPPATGTEDKAKDKAPAGDQAKPQGDEKEDDAGAAHLTQSKGPVNLVLVADTDMLFDRFWMQMRELFGQRITIPTSNNVDFVINVLDNLAGSDALIGLRSRGQSVRPFHRLDALQSAAELRYRRTEQGLTEKMRQTERKLGELQIDSSGGAFILTDKQKAAVEDLRVELVAIRSQLRDVQHTLRRDIDALDTWLKALNIWAMPVVVSIVALVLGLVRRRRFRERVASA